MLQISAQPSGPVDRAIAAEESDGYLLALKGRTVALLVIAVLLFALSPMPAVFYYHGLLGVFILLGLLPAWRVRRGVQPSWEPYVFAALDAALLTFTLLVPNPLLAEPIPPQFGLRFGNFIYFFVLLAGLAFSYRTRLMLFGGLAGAACWTAGVVWIFSFPETTAFVPEGASFQEALALRLNPHFVDFGIRLQEVVVLLIVAGLLAMTVARSRRLVLSQVETERQRGNLARYFSPGTVERLAREDAPWSIEREQPAAVLFADMVGFTRWAETRSPNEVIALLRELHLRLETAVFDHHGTLDKFIGDGVMATFGTPETGPQDAANALKATQAILVSVEAWNRERIGAGDAPVEIAIGVHYGSVVVGDVGSARRLELAVLGDTVNIASRLERLTRDLGCRAAISEAAFEAALAVGADNETRSIITRFSQPRDLAIRGRRETVPIRTL